MRCGLFLQNHRVLIINKEETEMTSSILDAVISTVVSTSKQELIPRYSKVCREHKTDGSIVTEADTVMQEKLQQSLLKLLPNSVVLGEEMSTEQQARALASGKSVWCLDPLDGTSNFAFGIPYFAVSLALIEDGRVSFGLVYDPVRDECFTAENTKAYLNNKIICIETTNLPLQQSTAIIDFKRLTNKLSVALVSNSPFASQRNFGASALDWCWLAVGRGHVYLHGSQNIWDYAAGQFVFECAGGKSQTFTGESVFKHALEKRSALAAVDAGLFKQWRKWIKPYV